MPKLNVVIPNVEENITRPMAMAVVRQIAREIGIPDSTQVRFKGSGGSLPLVGSTLDDNKGRPAPIRFPGDANISIEVVEEYDSRFALSTPEWTREQPAILVDSPLGIAFWPVKERVKATANFKITASDKSTMDAWIQELRSRYTRGATENYFHNADYHYPIPPFQLLILIELHKLRENNQGYGEDFGQWWRSHSDKRYAVIRDQAGNNSTLCVKEHQRGIMGWFDFDDQPPKGEQENESGSNSITFSYRYDYDRVGSMSMEYPIMVHNQVLSQQYYETERPFEIEDMARYYSVSGRLHQDYSYKSHGATAYASYPGIPVPHFDDWLAKTKLPYTNDVFRFMIQVDPTNPHAVLSLENLGSWRLLPSAIRYIKSEPLTITQPFENVFNVALYRDQDLLNRAGLIISPDLDIHVVKPMQERHVHHLLVCMVVDITKLTTNALRKLCQYGDFAIAYLTILYPTQKLPTLNPDGTIGFVELMRLVEILSKVENTTIRNSGLAAQSGWKLVNNFTLATHRRDKDANSQSA